MTSKASIYEAIHLLDQVIEIATADRDALPGEAVKLVKSARAKLRKKLRAQVERSRRQSPKKATRRQSDE